MTPESSAVLLLGGATGKAALFVFVYIVKFCTVMYKQGSGTWSPESSHCGSGVCLSSVLRREITFAF